ncbi:hypothetical protein [Variovorax paradoxus]|uniref:hypothetical protein n=1 Tax=Variovorax paradoxus TaxID=34073 RepID=UPI00278792DC|nr:hypothetical protein [Variovorax paradoxus]MDP9932532.1 hypothetical protein [Variovorax paradoxus]
MNLSESVSVVGLVLGTAGSVLGVLNYLRDRHKVVVTLHWDLAVTEGSGYDHTKKWGVIRVTNVGRRATYVSHVALKLPTGYDDTHLLIQSGIAGTKLAEGDPTAVYVVEQVGMEAYAKAWHKIVAQVSDSTGAVWYSKKPRADERPAWAAGAG